MNEETVNSLISSFDQVVDAYFEKAILSDADHQVCLPPPYYLYRTLYNCFNNSDHK